MNSMAFSEISVRIQNFRAIKDANLKLNGLTVLSGLNGSGKSTVAKTLYYAIKTALNYDEILDGLLRRKFDRAFDEFSFFIDDLVRSMSRYSLVDKENFSAEDLFSPLAGKTGKEFIRCLEDALDKITVLSEKIESVSEERRRNFLRSLLRRANQKLVFDDDNPVDLNNSQSGINCAVSQNAWELISQTEEKKEKRSLPAFIKLCSSVFGVEIPDGFSYQEGDVEIFDKDEKRVRPIQDFKIVHYIDTPWVIDFPNNRFSFITLPHAHWKDILEKIDTPDDFSGHSSIAEDIAKTIIKGYATRRSNEPRLFFERTDNVRFLLRDAATGIKGLSIIQRLAEKHAFDEKTLLILDEPESHLHPQWIVEYARILVLMQKELGVKILIASHSPDMIDALQTFSESAGIADRTNFYLAEESASDSFLYTYEPLGNSIAKIFKVFNVAATRIANYEKDLGKNAD